MNSTQHHRPLVLGIESSCDETGVGIVRGTQLLTNTVSSSMDEHVRFGGVIPEIASRAHLDAFVPTLREALAEAGVTLADIDAIAVTSGPGLAGALMVGVCAAKALAVATGKPLYAINHLVAHVGVGLLRRTTAAGSPSPAPRRTRPARPTPCRRTWVPCWSPAGTPKSCGSGTSPGTSSCWGPPSTTPPARPTTRWRGSWASAIRAARPSTSWPARATPRRSASRAASASPSTWAPRRNPARTATTGPSADSRPPSHAAWSSSRPAARRCRWRTSPQPSRRPSWTSSPPKPCWPAARTASPSCCSAAAWRRIHGCAQLTEQRCSAAGIRLTVPPLALCTDNGAMVAALGAQLVMAGHRAERHRLRAGFLHAGHHRLGLRPSRDSGRPG